MKHRFFALLLIAGLFFNNYAFAQESPISLEDKIIGSTFKALARTFVFMVDINKLRKDNIAKLNKMDNDKFRKRYAKVYKVIKDLPYSLRYRYKINEYTTKEQAIMDVESLDKDEIYQIIDAVPDDTIACQFKQHLRYKKQTVQKDNLITQINNYWNDLLKKINLTTPQHTTTTNTK